MQLPKPVRVVTLALLAGAFAVSCSPAGTGGGAPSSSGGGGGGASSGGRTGSGGSTSGSGGSSNGTGGSSTGSGGSGTGGSASGGSSGSGGATASGGSSGSSGGGSGGTSTDATTEAAPAETGGGDASGGPGWAGVTGIEDLSTVKKSEGCGMDPGQALGSWVPFNVMITPKPIKGGNRSYFIKLPANYDRNKAYRVIFVVPGCGGRGDNMFDFTTAAGTDGVIQIGMNPDPLAFSYAGCFDDFSTTSVEPQYFETLLGIANKKLCFDQHRVFFTGHSSGSFVSNMMGCIYGSTKVRAVAPSSGGLADNSMGMNMAPPCKPLPTPGIWSHNEDDGVAGGGNLIVWSQKAITRALVANKCQGTFATSPRIPYPGNPNCEKFMTCPAEFPIVFCHPKTGGHEGNKDIQPARSWEFFKSF